jgi:tetratricopeptide (TPR) repeat protein
LSRIQELKRNLSLSLQESSWDDALSVLGKLVEMEGSQPAYHNQIGDILLKSGRRIEAMESFMRGVHAYRELEMFPNGAALCKKILRLDPEQRDATWFLGELKTRQGFLNDGAEKMLEGLRAYAEDPAYIKSDLLEKLGHAESLQAGNREALEFVATSYARMNEPDMARCTTLRIAELEEREGKSDKARELRRHAQELCPEGGAIQESAIEEEAPEPPSAEADVVEERPEAIDHSEPVVESFPVQASPDESSLEPAPAFSKSCDISPIELPAAGIEVDGTLESLTVTSPSDPPDEVPIVVESSIESVIEPMIETSPEAGFDEQESEETAEAIPEAVSSEEEVELLEITVPEALHTEPELIEITQPTESEEPVTEDEPVLELGQKRDEAAVEDLETMEFILPEAPDTEFQALLNPDVERECDAWPSEEEPQGVDESENTNALASSMLELMGEESDDLPEIEILAEGSESQEDLLTTRQLVDDLRGGLADGSGVELIHEDGEMEVLSISSPGADERRGESEEVAASTEEEQLELHSLDDSLLEADGDWSGEPAAEAPAEESSPDSHREIHFDAGGDGKPISFGLTTTAGEALQTDDVEEVLGEFRRRMKEQMGSMAPEERYQLGVSYMEMGLHEEALDEFEHTLEHKVLGARTREWMARCFLELSRPREIVLLLQTKLDAESYPHKSMVELYYVLGQAYEMLKAWDLALDAFTKVYQLDAEFRGVQEKLAILTNAE